MVRHEASAKQASSAREANVRIPGTPWFCVRFFRECPTRAQCFAVLATWFCRTQTIVNGTEIASSWCFAAVTFAQGEHDHAGSCTHRDAMRNSIADWRADTTRCAMDEAFLPLSVASSPCKRTARTRDHAQSAARLADHPGAAFGLVRLTVSTALLRLANAVARRCRVLCSMS